MHLVSFLLKPSSIWLLFSLRYCQTSGGIPTSVLGKVSVQRLIGVKFEVQRREMVFGPLNLLLCDEFGIDLAGEDGMEIGSLAMPVIEHGVDVGSVFASGAVGRNWRIRPLMCSVRP